MFHCNGWCFTGAVTAARATHVCLPRVEADAIWEVIDDAGVTHMCAAPTVISTITSAPSATISLRKVWVATGGAPPVPALLARARTCGLDVTHLYSMTETYGPAVINEWDRVWDAGAGGRARSAQQQRRPARPPARSPRAVQGPRPDRVRDAPHDRHGKDPEVPARATADRSPAGLSSGATLHRARPANSIFDWLRPRNRRHRFDPNAEARPQLALDRARWTQHRLRYSRRPSALSLPWRAADSRGRSPSPLRSGRRSIELCEGQQMAWRVVRNRRHLDAVAAVDVQ